MDPIPVCSSYGGFASILAFPSAREVVQSILQLSAGCWLTRYWYKIHYDLELVPVMCCEYGCPAPPYLGRPGDQSFVVEVKSSLVCTCVCKYVSVFVRYHNTIRSYTYHFTISSLQVMYIPSRTWLAGLLLVVWLIWLEIRCCGCATY